MSMFFVAEIEAVAVTGVFQWCRAVDEKHGVVDVVSLAQFCKNAWAKTFVLVGSSFVCSSSLVSGSTAAYSQ